MHHGIGISAGHTIILWCFPRETPSNHTIYIKSSTGRLLSRPIPASSVSQGVDGFMWQFSGCLILIIIAACGGVQPRHSQSPVSANTAVILYKMYHGIQCTHIYAARWREDRTSSSIHISIILSHQGCLFFFCSSPVGPNQTHKFSMFALGHNLIFWLTPKTVRIFTPDYPSDFFR